LIIAPSFTIIIDRMMKRVLHISICQQFWNDKLPLNVYLKIEHLMWTLVTWLWEFEFGFSNIKQKIGVEKRGNDNCWFHCTICYTRIQLTNNNQNKWTMKRTQIENNKQHFQTSNLHSNSSQWPLWISLGTRLLSATKVSSKGLLRHENCHMAIGNPNNL
jgi:hypothetical protein